MTIAIIGAGISGLACAHKLLELGANDIHVFEASDTAGGLCRTLKLDDFSFDLGPHQLHTSDSTIISLLQNILGDDLTECPRHAGMRMHGKLLNYPLGISDLLTGLPAGTAIASAMDFAKARLRHSPPPRSFKEWVLANYGERLYHQYFEPYTRKVWGCEPDELSTDCAEERLASQSLWDVVMSALNSRKHQHSYLTHSPYCPSFFYPKHGVGDLPSKWAEQLKHDGVTFHYRARVSSIRRKLQDLALHFEDGEALTCDRAISTLPLDSLSDMLKIGGFPSVPDAGIQYRSMIFVMIALKNRPRLDYHWIYYPEDATSFLRVTQFHAIAPDMAPLGEASLCTETTCNYNDDTWRADDEILTARAIADLCADGMISESDVIRSFVHRERYAYPFMHTRYRENLSAILDYVDVVPGLYTTGRQGAFKYLDVCDLIPVASDTAVEANRPYSPQSAK